VESDWPLVKISRVLCSSRFPHLSAKCSDAVMKPVPHISQSPYLISQFSFYLWQGRSVCSFSYWVELVLLLPVQSSFLLPQATSFISLLDLQSPTTPQKDYFRSSIALYSKHLPYPIMPSQTQSKPSISHL